MFDYGPSEYSHLFGNEDYDCSTDGPENYRGRSSRYYYSEPKDDLYYHNAYVDLVVDKETDKAILFKDKVGKFWCPKKLVRKSLKEEGVFYIHRTFSKKHINQYKCTVLRENEHAILFEDEKGEFWISKDKIKELR